MFDVLYQIRFMCTIRKRSIINYIWWALCSGLDLFILARNGTGE